MKFRLYGYLLSILLLFGLLNAPLMGGAVLMNKGMLGLRDNLLEEKDVYIGTYPFYGVLESSPPAHKAVRNLRNAVVLNADNFAARWAWGRAALSVGDVQTAINAFEPLVEEGGHNNALLYSDVLIAFSQAERPESVTGLYELVPPPQQTQTISNTVVRAYLEQGGQIALERAIMLRPGDLYANYFLWKQAQTAGNTEAAVIYRETITHFPIEAINPTVHWLLDYTGKVIPDLLEDDLWDLDKTLNVVSYLVWQHHEAPGVERLLVQMVERFPTQPDWSFYLAELYHRRGVLNKAEVIYRQVLALDPKYAQAYLRLGMVSEEASEREDEEERKRLSEAAGWYEQYNVLAPDDLLGLKRLSETCATLESLGVENGRCREATDRLSCTTQYAPCDLGVYGAAVRDVLAFRTDDRRIVGEMLGVPVENVELGPNLVPNGGFEEWDDASPTGWKFGTYLGKSGDEGLYVAGQDTLGPGGGVVRIISLWGGAVPDGTMTYAEYVGKEIPITDAKYLVSLSYRSWGFTEGSGIVFLGEYTRLGGSAFLYESLPLSGGKWEEIHLLIDGDVVPTPVMPLVRNWGVGQLSIQSLEIRPITYRKGS